MKDFFRRRVPVPGDILLIESGSPDVALRATAGIRKFFPKARFHLCTCFANSVAEGYESVYRVTEYPGTWKKLGLLFAFRRRPWDVLVILCTREPILWRWKALAALLIPAKVLIVNENADFFWLDWGNRRAMRLLLSHRWGVNLEQSFYTLLRALIFPVTFLILLGTAGFLYLRRARRLIQWKLAGIAPATGSGRQARATLRKKDHNGKIESI